MNLVHHGTRVCWLSAAVLLLFGFAYLVQGLEASGQLHHVHEFFAGHHHHHGDNPDAPGTGTPHHHCDCLCHHVPTALVPDAQFSLKASPHPGSLRFQTASDREPDSPVFSVEQPPQLLA